MVLASDKGSSSGSLPMLEEETKQLLTTIKGKKAMIILNKYDLPLAVDVEEIKQLSGEVPIIHLSAQYGSGMSELEDILRKMTEKQETEAGRELFLTNMRHVELVRKALEAVNRAKTAAEEGALADFIVVDLTEAWNLLGEITGDTVDDELIHSIFSSFCVGK